MMLLRVQGGPEPGVRMYPGGDVWVVSDTAHTSEEVHVDRR